MKLLKAALFTALFSCAGLANAELISNVPLDTSRFELMPISELSSRAAQGNDHAQFYLAKRLQKGEGVAQNTQQAIQWYTKAARARRCSCSVKFGYHVLARRRCTA